MKAPRSQKSGITCTPPAWLQSAPRSANSVADATQEDALTGGGFMKIIGTKGLTDEQIHQAIERGAKFVVFQYCISVFLMTFKRSSDVYFIRPGHTALTPRIGYSILSLLLGWWGIPWGPIYTIQAFWNNAIGGLDLTPEVLRHSVENRAVNAAD
jgi:hypothetical protein